VFRAATRNGAVLEFSTSKQLLAWLLIARDQTNDYLRSFPKASVGRMPLEEWLSSQVSSFVKRKVHMFGAKLLFKGQYTGLFISRMFSDS